MFLSITSLYTPLLLQGPGPTSPTTDIEMPVSNLNLASPVDICPPDTDQSTMCQKIRNYERRIFSCMRRNPNPTLNNRGVSVLGVSRIITFASLPTSPVLLFHFFTSRDLSSLGGASVMGIFNAIYLSLVSFGSQDEYNAINNTNASTEATQIGVTPNNI